MSVKYYKRGGVFMKVKNHKVMHVDSLPTPEKLTCGVRIILIYNTDLDNATLITGEEFYIQLEKVMTRLKEF